MSKVVLIQCSAGKKNQFCKARDLYIGPLFKKSLKYSELVKADKVFILSAKHYLLKLNKKINPYNKTLNKMRKKDRKLWANKVLTELEKETDIMNDNFIILAGEKYREFIIPSLNNFEAPLLGLSIGKQLQFLNNKISGYG